MDQLAQDLIIAVNDQHSQGVGLELFSQTKGTYQVSDPAVAMSTSLPLGGQIVAGTLQISVDRDRAPLVMDTIAIDPSLSLNDLVVSINTHPLLGTYLTASVEENSIKIVTDLASDTFGFAGDDSHVLTALGVNTYFTGDKAYTLGVNAWVLNDPNLVAAGQIDATGDHALGDNRNALALADLEDTPVGTGGLTLGETYQNLVMSLGLEAREAGTDPGRAGSGCTIPDLHWGQETKPSLRLAERTGLKRRRRSHRSLERRSNRQPDTH